MVYLLLAFVDLKRTLSYMTRIWGFVLFREVGIRVGFVPDVKPAAVVA